MEKICAGLFITYPTSYEALVGRAKLQAGTHTTYATIVMC